MKSIITLILFFLFQSSNNLYSSVNTHDGNCEVDTSGKDYGQKPPGKIAIHFSPSFIKTEHRIHSSTTFSSDMTEVYWSIFPRTSEFKHRKETIIFSKKVKDKWTSPKVASFSGEFYDGGPFFSHDGTKLYFYSKRPVDKNSKSETSGEIWFVLKQGENWGDPKHIELDLEGEKLFFSMSNNNNIYFTSGFGYRGIGGGSVDIYCAKFINGIYAKPERLPGVINSEQFVESDPFISPDEKSLIFYSLERPENIGQYDLYICNQNENGQWTKPTNLGSQINKGVARFPPDGRYLFFVKSNGVYWIDYSIFHDK